MRSSTSAEAALHRPPPPADLLSGYTEHRVVVSVLMAGHHLRVLNAWYRLFDGDILMPLVALEIWCAAAAADGPFLAHRYPVAQLAPATGVARESARRRLHRLQQLGWLRAVDRCHVVPTETLAAAFHPARARWVCDDFHHTAALLRSALALDAAPAERNRLRAALVLAARTTEPAATPAFSTQMAAAPPREGALTLKLGVQIGRYNQRHLRRLLREFDGDLLLPLLLGEVAHFNISALLRHPAADLATIEAVLSGAQIDPAPLALMLRPCNAHSLATATGVPDTTVRRRLDGMVARGWLTPSPDGGLYLARGLAEEFEDVNVETAQDFLATDERVRALCAPAANENGR